MLHTLLFETWIRKGCSTMRICNLLSLVIYNQIIYDITKILEIIRNNIF